MAKSLRAKTKQANRRKKRQDEHSHYAAVEASRVQRVSDKLLGKDKDKEAEAEKGETVAADAGEDGPVEDMDGDEDMKESRFKAHFCALEAECSSGI